MIGQVRIKASIRSQPRVESQPSDRTACTYPASQSQTSYPKSHSQAVAERRAAYTCRRSCPSLRLSLDPALFTDLSPDHRILSNRSSPSTSPPPRVVLFACIEFCGSFVMICFTRAFSGCRSHSGIEFFLIALFTGDQPPDQHDQNQHDDQLRNRDGSSSGFTRTCGQFGVDFILADDLRVQLDRRVEGK